MYRIIVAITTLISLLYFSSCQMAEKTDYIFPYNYQGRAIVVFNAKNGEEVIYNNGRATVNIPSDGILFTKQIAPEGIVNNRFRYFIKNASGGLDRVSGPYDEVPHNDSSTPYIVGTSQGRVFCDTTANSKNEIIASFDDITVFKIGRGKFDYLGFTDEVDKYLDSLRPVLISRANNK